MVTEIPIKPPLSLACMRVRGYNPSAMNDEIAYQEALDYIYTFIDYSLKRSFRYSPDKFDLGRMVNFTSLLGSPEKAYPVIHVAGTKGKGSVAALCASALRACGFRVGIYTSPHLQDYAERIQVDGKPISHANLVAYVEEMKPKIADVPELTTFEITTALAFLYFARQQVDVAVIEVGLGGRLDATNIVDPLVSVITSISYDHTELLGNTLAEIAGEKAGIIKPGRPVVIAPQVEEARAAIQRIARQRQSPVLQVGTDYLYALVGHSLQQQELHIWPSTEQTLIEAGDEHGQWEARRFIIPLLGQHQVENAATAYAALQMARMRGLKITEGAIRKGFAAVEWPGRFEFLRLEPPIIVDSAHNRDSALKLRQTLDDYLPYRRVILIIGVSEDKDIAGMFEELMPRVDHVVATQSVHPRALEPANLVEIASSFDKPAQVAVTVEQALQEALRLAGSDAIILAAGSIFLAAAVRFAWLSREEDLPVVD
jgi:dihydrofolate synthase / folylpolyglutamate synthase